MTITLFIISSQYNCNIQVMLTQKQFQQLYDDAVIMIRQIKNMNDYINKKIGNKSEQALRTEIQVDEEKVMSIKLNIDKILSLMQQNYLDPITARKIGTLKQQFRTQTTRRNEIIQSDKFLYESSQNICSSSRRKERVNQNTNEKHMSMVAKSSQTIKSEGKMQGKENYLDHHPHQEELQRTQMEQRKKEIINAKRQFLNLNNFVKQTNHLVQVHGEKIYQFGAQMCEGSKMVSFTNEHFDDANARQKNYSSKYRLRVILILFVLAVIGIIIFS